MHHRHVNKQSILLTRYLFSGSKALTTASIWGWLKVASGSHKMWGVPPEPSADAAVAVQHLLDIWWIGLPVSMDTCCVHCTKDSSSLHNTKNSKCCVGLLLSTTAEVIIYTARKLLHTCCILQMCWMLYMKRCLLRR